MTHTPISDSTFSFLSLFMLNVPVYLTFFTGSQRILQINYLILWFTEYIVDSFRNWSAHASNQGNHFKASGQLSFSTCLRCQAKSDITFRQTFGYVVGRATSYATLWLYL